MSRHASGALPEHDPGGGVQGQRDHAGAYDVKNVTALADIEALGDITILPYPDDVMAAAKAASDELYEELRGDVDFNTVFESWDAFRQSSGAGSVSPRPR